MIRSVHLTDDDAKTLDQAARYLRTLTVVEKAHAEGDPFVVTAALGSVDPIDLTIVEGRVTDLHALYFKSAVRLMGDMTAA